MSFFSGRRQGDTAHNSQTTPASNQSGFDTVLSANTVLNGQLKSEGNIRLDGQLTGKLEITGNVLVGETADIHADIAARNVSIAGQVHGNVTGNKVQILKSGRIWGDIKANSLSTEEGAFIEGKVAMSSEPIIADKAEPIAPVIDMMEEETLPIPIHYEDTSYDDLEETERTDENHDPHLRSDEP